MIPTRDFFTFLTCTVMTTFFSCYADRLPPPTELSHSWLDPFTVIVSWSWQMPSTLPHNCQVKYNIRRLVKGLQAEEDGEGKRTESRNYTDSCLTGDADSDPRTYIVNATLGNKSCGWSDSTDVHIIIKSPKPRAEVVKDFKCVLEPSGANCSWIPVNRSLALTLSYRFCGISEELRKSLKNCDQHYNSGTRSGCYLKGANETDICVLVETETGRMTFKPLLVIPPPNLRVKEDKDTRLVLSWTPPAVGRRCTWMYSFCYTQCNGPSCQNFTREMRAAVNEKTHRMPYNKNCLYTFKSKVSNTGMCPTISSDWSEVVTYGANKPDGMLTAVAIVIPIILLLCVAVSCYCFRRHSDIICPIIPDPSVIFKEMMMNGSKELKTTAGSLYTPVPEPIEPCKITPVD